MSGLVTVFGGSGFVGTQVVRVLAKQGWRIRVAVRRPHLAQRLRPMGDVGQIQLQATNVLDTDSVGRALDGADACVNLVGLLYQTANRRFRRVHIEGARNVAEAAAARGVKRMVQMSALGAHPDAASEYASSKGEAEVAVRKHVPSAVVIRPSIVFGSEDRFFNRFASMATSGPVLPLIGGGKTRFQPVFVGDVASAVATALSDPAAAGADFDLGGPEVFSFRQLMQMVCRETGHGRLLVPVPWSIAGLIGTAGDVGAFVTGIEPPVTSDQVLLLQSDNVVASGAKGLEALGITPTSVEAILPTYLWRYRRGGQFAEILPAA